MELGLLESVNSDPVRGPAVLFEPVAPTIKQLRNDWSRVIAFMPPASENPLLKMLILELASPKLALYFSPAGCCLADIPAIKIRMTAPIIMYVMGKVLR